MPELPEVEVVRRGLAAHVCGCTIVSAEVYHPRVARNQPGGLATLQDRLSGRRISAVSRRGKFLWIELDDATGLVLLVHLGMSGQMLIKSAGTAPVKHLRARLVLDDDAEVWFVDQRTFGYWWVGEMAATGPKRIDHIAPDLLQPGLDLRQVAKDIQSRRSEIKRVLLNQAIVSGIGNIYADEMLWAASIHPQQDPSRLSLDQIVELLIAGQRVMERALEVGGTSFDELYVNVNGESGYFDLSLNAYGQQGKPCPRCGTDIVRLKFANRSSHVCLSCQRM